jgi:hypothetical protein
MFRPLALLAAMALGSPASAQVEPYDPDAIEVDVELLLLVDVSRSMTINELEIQRRGYAEALISPEVLTAINGGMLGSVAIAYVEWAGSYSQRIVQDWAIVRTREDAEAFADAIALHHTAGMRRTSISSALTVGAEYFRANRFTGLRRVIDISGDGPNNDGMPVLRARDAVLAQGITINGLPLMTREGMGGMWTIDRLDLYYRDCVIGGTGAFVVPVLDWSEFAAAVRKKLVLEIAGDLPETRRADTWPEAAAPRVQLAQASPPTDCLIGEKIWERYRDSWEP